MEQLLTVPEVAELLQFPKQTVYQMVSQRRLPVIRFSGRCLRFRRSDIDAFIAGKLVPAGAPPEDKRAVIRTGKPGRPRYALQDIDNLINAAKKEVCG